MEANLPDVDLPDDLADGWRIRAATARARNAAARAAMRVPLDEAVGAAEELRGGNAHRVQAGNDVRNHQMARLHFGRYHE